MSAAQIKLVRLDVLSLALAERAVLGRGQLQLQLIDDVSRNLVLDLKDIFDIAVVPLRPDLITITCAYELGADTNAAVHATNASLEYCLYV